MIYVTLAKTCFLTFELRESNNGFGGFGLFAKVAPNVALAILWVPLGSVRATWSFLVSLLVGGMNLFHVLALMKSYVLLHFWLSGWLLPKYSLVCCCVLVSLCRYVFLRVCLRAPLRIVLGDPQVTGLPETIQSVTSLFLFCRECVLA